MKPLPPQPLCPAALLKLSALDSGAFEDFYHCLAAAPADLSLTRLSLHISRNLPNLPQRDVEQVLTVLVEAYAHGIRTDLDTSEYSARLIDTVAADARNPLALDKDARNTVLDRLRRLMLLSGPISLVAKGRAILADTPRRLTKARVLTDIRPVFADDVTHRPAAAIVLHTLNLSYRDGSVARLFTLHLDATTLSQLVASLEHARLKEASLHETLHSFGLPLLPTGPAPED